MALVESDSGYAAHNRKVWLKLYKGSFFASYFSWSLFSSIVLCSTRSVWVTRCVFKGISVEIVILRLSSEFEWITRKAEIEVNGKILKITREIFKILREIFKIPREYQKHLGKYLIFPEKYQTRPINTKVFLKRYENPSFTLDQIHFASFEHFWWVGRYQTKEIIDLKWQVGEIKQFSQEIQRQRQKEIDQIHFVLLWFNTIRK